MSSCFGQILRLSVFGQSHGPAIGMVLDGFPVGFAVNEESVQKFLDRRAPGNQAYATSRKEADQVHFLSGIVNGITCGAPIAAVIENTNTRSKDYSSLKDCPRPGHADYTAQIKYKGFQDVAGGGHFSGRLTAPICIAGALCKEWLSEKGVQIAAKIHSIGGICDAVSLDPISPDLDMIASDFPVADRASGERMQEAIAQAKANADSLGGTIQCYVKGLPVGLGEPMFDGLESRLAQILFAIPAVKGVEFGSGFQCANMLGSTHNDPYTVKDGKVITKSNHAGGILGGISNGMPLTFRIAIKPTPSIGSAQQSISLSAMEDKELSITGRHDPCIVPRAVAVVEAAASIAIMDAWLQYQAN